MDLKVDVCLVTKNPEIPEGWLRTMNHVPLNNLIVETSSPLGEARRRAIEKVRTEWFAFIDDDMYVTRNWFPQLSKHIDRSHERVGAVQGFPWYVGVNQAWSKIFNVDRRPAAPVKLKPGERGKTHNTLIRTDLVKDWRPSTPTLSSWEDYEITQHILRRNHDWVVCPADACHVVTPWKIWGSAAWKIKGWKNLFKPKPLTLGRKTAYQLLGIPYHLLKFLAGQETLGELGYWFPNNLVEAIATILS